MLVLTKTHLQEHTHTHVLPAQPGTRTLAAFEVLFKFKFDSKRDPCDGKFLLLLPLEVLQPSAKKMTFDLFYTSCSKWSHDLVACVQLTGLRR